MRQQRVPAVKHMGDGIPLMLPQGNFRVHACKDNVAAVIYYNCVGALFVPDTEALPAPEVTVNTRRGVYVTYEPAQNE